MLSPQIDRITSHRLFLQFPGRQSAIHSHQFVLAADACYFCQTLRERRLPRYVQEEAAPFL